MAMEIYGVLSRSENGDEDEWWHTLATGEIFHTQHHCVAAAMAERLRGTDIFNKHTACLFKADGKPDK